MRYAIVLLLVIGACSRGTPATEEQSAQQESPAAEAPAEAPAESPAAKAEGPALSLDTAATLALVDNGKPPHKALRTSFKPGSKHALRVRSEWEIAASYGPFASPNATMPSFTYALEAEVKEVTNGTARFGFRVVEVSAKSSDAVKPAQVEEGKSAAASLQGVTGSFTIDPRGLVQAFSIGARPEATTMVHDMLEQIERGIRLASLPLPEEPIGEGATWTTTHVMKQRGALTEQASTYELVSTDGPRLQAKVTHQMTAPKQIFSLSGNPAKASYKLVELGVEGQGQGTWELGRLTPPSASEKTAIVFKMTIVGAKPAAVLMSNSTTLQVDRGR